MVEEEKWEVGEGRVMLASYAFTELSLHGHADVGQVLGVSPRPPGAARLATSDGQH